MKFKEIFKPKVGDIAYVSITEPISDYQTRVKEKTPVTITSFDGKLYHYKHNKPDAMGKYHVGSASLSALSKTGDINEF